MATEEVDEVGTKLATKVYVIRETGEVYTAAEVQVLALGVKELVADIEGEENPRVQFEVVQLQSD